MYHTQYYITHHEIQVPVVAAVTVDMAVRLLGARDEVSRCLTAHCMVWGA